VFMMFGLLTKLLGMSRWLLLKLGVGFDDGFIGRDVSLVVIGLLYCTLLFLFRWY